VTCGTRAICAVIFPAQYNFSDPHSRSDHHHVARPDVVQQPLHLRPVPSAAKCFLFQQTVIRSRVAGGTVRKLLEV
jgi:hypothetical protein